MLNGGILQEIHRRITRLWGYMFEAIFPPRCVICGTLGEYICHRHQDFQPPRTIESPEYLDGIFAVATYTDPLVPPIIERFKYKGLRGMGQILGKKMVQVIPKNVPNNAVIVPIPLHWTRKIWRGYNQSEILAKTISNEVHIPFMPLIRKQKSTKQQATLTSRERIKNVEDVFYVVKNSEIPKVVLLVDDVYTTGATMNSAAKVLKNAGVSRVYGLCFATS